MSRARRWRATLVAVLAIQCLLLYLTTLPEWVPPVIGLAIGAGYLLVDRDGPASRNCDHSTRK